MISELAIRDDNAKQVCSQLCEQWKRDDLKVFVLRGESKRTQVRDWHESLFPLIGTPAHLAEDVRIGDRDQQRTGGIWMEVRYDSRFPDAYRHSANAQPLHTDGSYIPSFPNASLMTCIANTAEGGETTFIDSLVLLQILRREAPELLDELLSTIVPHARSGDRRDEQIIRQAGDRIWVNWNYYCVAKDTTPAARVLAESFHRLLQNSPGVKAGIRPVKLLPGDAVVWKDAEVLHGRNAFVPTRESDRFIWKCAIDVGIFRG
ncbi:MAG: TauD/TfdA family dioxygenase [Planctomycetes bacterium]|nr:TauD/TfdA family dioxygenase [Planctomycetota bacterium]